MRKYLAVIILSLFAAFAVSKSEARSIASILPPAVSQNPVVQPAPAGQANPDRRMHRRHHRRHHRRLPRH